MIAAAVSFVVIVLVGVGAVAAVWQWRRERMRARRRAELEGAVLELAEEHGGSVTVPVVALRTGASIDESEALLDELAGEGHARLEVDDEGRRSYVFPGLDSSGRDEIDRRADREADKENEVDEQAEIDQRDERDRRDEQEREIPLMPSASKSSRSPSSEPPRDDELVEHPEATETWSEEVLPDPSELQEARPDTGQRYAPFQPDAVAVVLDSSEAMARYGVSVVEAYNAVLKEIRSYSTNDATLTRTVFDENIPPEVSYEWLDSAEPLTAGAYRPGGGAALMDAVGHTVAVMRERIEQLPPARTPDDVLVAVITEGEDTASENYGPSLLRGLVESCRRDGWRFCFVGADLDDFADVRSIGRMAEEASPERGSSPSTGL